MKQRKNSSQGFTLIAALLIMVLLSGVAVGLFYVVTNEARMGGNDLEANLAYYGAESGMEKLTADLSSLYTQYQAPTNLQIQNLINFPPTSAMVNGMNYVETITYPTDAGGNPVSGTSTVSSGSNAGLYAEIIPMTLQVIATRPAGASINITRKVEVALIPVFQFGVFCGYDCSYFPGPDFSFGGRVHTNQSLFLAAGGNLVFNDKISAFTQVIMDQLENGHSTSVGYGGTVFVPKASAGCPLNTFPPTGANCVALPGAATVPGDASWSGGYPTIGGSANINFQSLSSATLNYFVTNALTGAKNMQLPFVQNSCTSNPPPIPCTDPIAIIRRPQTESPNSTLGTARLYNEAQIRILIADTLADLHPDRGTGALDANDVLFPNLTTSPNASIAVPTGLGPEAFGFAAPGSNGWVNPLTDSGPKLWASIPLIGELTTNPSTPSAMTGPWIRVEYCNAPPPAPCVGVTNEWLALGFGRVFNTPPTTPNSNSVNPNAILILQQLRPTITPTAAHVAGSGNWYPINFYDAREGEMRDNNVPNLVSGTKTYSSCSVNGIMNAVELDVGNLARWLNTASTLPGGHIAGSGGNVNYTNYNGYVLYFSDHRGMLPSTHPSNGGQTAAGVINGESGIEDVVNSAQNLTSFNTDGVAEALSYYGYSPEDVDQNGFLDNWGEKNIGYGFGIATNTPAPYNPYKRINVANPGAANSIDCAAYNPGTTVTPLPAPTAATLLTGNNDQQGVANPVSGARHVLKLVDAGLIPTGQSPLPVTPPASLCTYAASSTGCGGFTIASENPVYVQGNYNSSAADPFWGTANNVTPSQTPHSAAAIIADSVTVLSNSWSDVNSLTSPTAVVNRITTADAYYRMAVSGGKNIPFPSPGWANTAGINDFGTDGGLHNFLRYLEDWNNTLHYDGSLVSMYYSEYNTGTFKCCTTVYNPPTRNYYFDVLFLNPANLPPATPEFEDINSLSYHENFTPQ